MNRIYLSKLLGNGKTLNTAHKAAWLNLLPSVKSHGALDPKYGFWIGEIETTEEQHNILNESSKVRWINHTALDIKFESLTDDQKNKVYEIVEFLGFDNREMLAVFAPTATVRDFIHWLIGHACHAALKSFD